jgi:hypothetical protein
MDQEIADQIGVEVFDSELGRRLVALRAGEADEVPR